MAMATFAAGAMPTVAMVTTGARPQGQMRGASKAIVGAKEFMGSAVTFQSSSMPKRTAVQVSAVQQKLPPTHSESSAKALQSLKDNGARYTQEKKASIMAIGLSVHTAPVELREKLAVVQAEWPRAIAELTSYPHVEEAGVLSTCNRMEIYVSALSWHRGVREVEQWMSNQSGVPLEELRPYLFLLRDGDAVSHLMRVSAGLDSIVMGEGQILSQVKSVYQVGNDCPGFGRQLTGLFKQAITAGKRVRTETSISTGAVSVSSAAAELAQLKLPTHKWEDARVCIIGAGKMSRLLVKHLASKGCSKMTILNRSLPRAEELAADFPECDITIELMPELMRCVADSDVIFAASGSEDILIHESDVESMPAPLEVVGGIRHFVDISVPRNIGPMTSAPAKVYNVDDLKEVVDSNKEARQQAAEEALVLLAEEQATFESWRDSLETVPTIKRLRGKAESIRMGELDKALGRMGEGLTKKERKVLEELSRGIVNKLLHGPMQALRPNDSDPSQIEDTLQNMYALERMFSLSDVIEEEVQKKKKSRAKN